LKRLEEIEARVAAAPKGPWKWTDDGLHATSYPFPRTNDGMWLIGSDCNECSVPDDTHYYPIEKPTGDLIAHAPTDLALLARLVRLVAEAQCEKHGNVGMDCERWLKAYTGEMDAALAKYGCWPCRIRRELAEAKGAS
jgi:hypothetical protein